ncbi:MAG: hypothetical protein ACRDJM_08730, partial [Actinomycetota bacterium]
VRLSAKDLGELGPALAQVGDEFEMNGRISASGDQIVDVKTGRTQSGTGKGSMVALMLVDGKEVMRMTMHLTFSLEPETRTAPSAV